METGINAWIANCKFAPTDDTGKVSHIYVELPDDWKWDIMSDGTGFLKGPDDMLCIGYDIPKKTIQFGNDGETKAPGLNLWTVQDVGEKFARQYFMDEETGRRYDEFAKERGDKRKEYEKGVRAQMTGLIQLEIKDGKWAAHVDREAVNVMTGIDVPAPDITREEGIALFNKMSEARSVMPLRNPLGYMTLDNNLYDYIKDQYEFQYEDTIQNIDAGFINGNGHGCEAILENLDATVRKNIREYCLPEGTNYQDLRHIRTTSELCRATDEFVKQRVTKTVNFEKKRDHSRESLQKDHENFLKAAAALSEKIGDITLPDDPLELPVTEINGMTI